MSLIKTLIIVSLGAAVAACGDNKLGPSVPASISAVSGDSQTVLAGNRSSAPIVAVVKNSNGSPLANVQVRWRVTAGGGSLLAVADTTDANGTVSTTYLSPALAGPAKIEASAGGQSRDFTMKIVADTVGVLSAYGGNGAAGLIGSQLNLVARATDRFGNPMTGVNVTWSSSSGSLQVPTGVTDTTGKASNVITVGPDAGQISIIASSRFNNATFIVSALQSP